MRQRGVWNAPFHSQGENSDARRSVIGVKNISHAPAVHGSWRFQETPAVLQDICQRLSRGPMEGKPRLREGMGVSAHGEKSVGNR